MIKLEQEVEPADTGLTKINPYCYCLDSESWQRLMT
jgi:hypothetical protein